jgi:hypothetical protein
VMTASRMHTLEGNRATDVGAPPGRAPGAPPLKRSAAPGGLVIPISQIQMGRRAFVASTPVLCAHRRVAATLAPSSRASR